VTEETIFAAALERGAPIDRAAYLDKACAGDTALRQRIDTLLQSHEADGGFLGKPAIQCAVEEIAGRGCDEDTQSADGGGDDALDFLAPSDKPGSIGRLGHYDVQEVVGRGGMGVVLKAFDEQLHRVVAIKVMAPQLASSANARKRFAREARAAAAVTHDQVVTIHAVEEAGPLPRIVMQFVAGESLQDRLDRTGPLPLLEVLRIGMQTAAGLAAAHAQGLVHRDVKPSNILLEDSVERVKLTDFGLARAADDASLTQSGVIAGTPAFMSPEQAQGRQVDHRSDLFSLGSVLYAACTGRPPFRASTSMGVLKRVCEDTPTPVRETNPEVPDWLVALVAKLHAKDPAARFQSAAEVAELLGQFLAHVQHPQVVPLPAAKWVASSSAQARLLRRTWWAVAAAVLALLVAVLGTTEATGVTNVRASLTRIFTPDETPDDQSNEPGVKVPPAAPIAEKGAFVVLSAGPERKYDTLADAVFWSGHEDTIEVRGNGPFVTDPITRTHGGALAIRAGKGFRPVLRLEPGAVERHRHLLSTNGPLILEGLEIQIEHTAIAKGPNGYVGVAAHGGILHVANCRFVVPSRHSLYVGCSRRAVVRNCEFLGGDVWSEALVGAHAPGGVWELENSVLVGGAAFVCEAPSPDVRDTTVRIRRCSAVSCTPVRVCFHTTPKDPESGLTARLVQFEASGNLMDTGVLMGTTHFPRFLEPSNPLHSATAEEVIHRLVEWRGSDNVHHRLGKGTPGPGHAMIWAGTLTSGEPVSGVNDLAAWRQFWDSPESGSIEGEIRYVGGNLATRLASGADKLTPEDFRLQPDSAGYRAGKDGKDLGADVDLVGPGPAYERWKQTPEYQQWLKETGSIRAVTPKAESNAFVVLGGPGVPERRFDTLAEAVLAVRDGDVVEVRGNGPFVTHPIRVASVGLTVRAADGFRPVIRLSESGAQTYQPMLETAGPLVLEGLEFQRLGQRAWTEGNICPSIIEFGGTALHVANCRFRMDSGSMQTCVHARRSTYTIRNSEFYGPTVALWCSVPETRAVTMENCVHLGRTLVALAALQPTEHELLVRVARSTVIPVDNEVVHGDFQRPGDLRSPVRAGKPVRIEAVDNLIDAMSVLRIWKPYAPVERPADEDRLRGALAWAERGNVYRVHGGYLDWGPKPEFSARAAADWRRFWGLPDGSAVEGEFRYAGGRLAAKLTASPEALTPEDFRLCPDSAGYRAGKDGKDLGADVNLVGPGPAYERWKKTPEYQQWLKETGSIRAVAPKLEPSAFVVLAGPGMPERKFETLAEAVTESIDGDTVEVRGNGPFETNRIEIRRPLTIRAGVGFRPVICDTSRSTNPDVQVIFAHSPLRLEGLEFRCTRVHEILNAQGPLAVASCRFLIEKEWTTAIVCGGDNLIKNCEVIAPRAAALCLERDSEATLVVNNCLLVGHNNFRDWDTTRWREVQFAHNTLVSQHPALLHILDMPRAQFTDRPTSRLRFTAMDNIFDSDTGTYCVVQGKDFKPRLDAADVEVWLKRRVEWREARNIHRMVPLIRCDITFERIFELACGKDLADWNRFWELKDTGSSQGVIKFKGGDLHARTAADAGKLAPEDFRLQSDSAGYRAGKDKNDLGADVDLVGPGPAYERWKKTSEYQQWLKETGHLKK
jgi:Protein kinase domain